jgi:hypothetical protein
MRRRRGPGRGEVGGKHDPGVPRPSSTSSASARPLAVPDGNRDPGLHLEPARREMHQRMEREVGGAEQVRLGRAGRASTEGAARAMG